MGWKWVGIHDKGYANKPETSEFHPHIPAGRIFPTKSFRAATAVFLVEISHSDLAPGFYISALAALAVWGVRVLETPKEVVLPPPHMPIQRDDEA